MVDYSKWDALELSDDSDIEVHPNVDKRSFIRAKQSQVHMERQQRKLQIEAYKHQRIVNDALLQRLSLLISTMEAQHTASVSDGPSGIAFKAIMESALRNPEDDSPPPRPDGLSDADSPPLPTYSKMMVRILDEANKALAQRQVEDNLRFEALVEELGVQIRTIQDVQTDLAKKLDEMEHQSSRKITSENYHVGFDSSHVSKIKAAEKSSGTKLELLNPNFKELPRASPAAKTFAQLKTSDYRASHDYLLSHPEILHESEVDGLFHETYSLLLDHGDEARARQCAHQALLLQYCRMLGRDGVALFFKRIATPGHQAREVFEKDLAEKFQRILGMAKRDAKETGSIRIQVPPAGSEDEEVRKARSTFESFAPEMRAALEHGSLDEINEVLGKMEYAKAENLVSLLNESGCLSIEGDIIDATTESGKNILGEIGKAGEPEGKEVD
ncbi:Cdc37 N terminal kinase binding-domain-containing protein [Chaetomidium leptoderma]|uniref:Hsp90 chaperone protein kinase-targeting subunit n=1 Tax=Chaetomidium leptoderma TaxID=669021 RepID=A0AAN6VK97_9PEZI|nr:Cdc37 N terminal kinase binding-domain-containing protein [Chaetomidium leptoderma]